MISHWIPVATCVVILGIVGCVDNDASPANVEEDVILDSEPVEVREKSSESESDPPTITTVDGNILIDDAPVEGLEVTFEPESGPPAIGLTDANGNFELQNTASGENILPGKYVVRISVPSGSEAKVQLSTSNNENSQLIAEVRPGSNRMDFQLNSK